MNTTGMVGCEVAKLTPKNGQVPAAVIYLSSRIGVVREQVTALYDKLGTVLRPAAPANTQATASEKTTPSATLAKDINALAEEIVSITNSLNEIMDRLEL